MANIEVPVFLTGLLMSGIIIVIVSMASMLVTAPLLGSTIDAPTQSTNFFMNWFFFFFGSLLVIMGIRRSSRFDHIRDGKSRLRKMVLSSTNA